MTLSELMRGLGHDGVLYSFHASAQKCVNLRAHCRAILWPTARRLAIELHLTHTVRIKVEVAYKRTGPFEGRRTLMDRWASYPDGTGEAVVPMGASWQVTQSNGRCRTS